MTPYDALTVMTAVALVCDCVADATGFQERTRLKGPAHGWDILAAALFLVWTVATIRGAFLQ